MIIKYVGTLLVTASLTCALQAQSLIFGRGLTSATCPPSCYNCPDDYCRKPMPCIPCFIKSCMPDDYCPKPIPCVPCMPKGCVDDYCPKPFSFCLPPSIRPWYSCGSCAK
jgi:hypothetical protein